MENAPCISEPLKRIAERDDWVRLGGAELELALREEWVKLVRADWLVEHARRGGALMKRQDMTPGAYIGLDELRRAGATKFGNHEWLRVIVLSYPWLQPGHPDPHGENLRVLAKVLRCYLEGARPYGVLIDFAGLFQEPRTPDEDTVFKLALPALNVFYSHPHTVVLKITKFPAGYPDHPKFPYDLPEDANTKEYAERGWCFAESSMSSLVKSSILVVDLGHYDSFISLGRVMATCVAGRDPPMHPGDFREALDGKTFTSKAADFRKVDTLYSDAFEQRLGRAAELHFDGLRWDGEQVQQLLRALESSRSLRMLDLGRNPIGDGGAEALARVLESNTQLRTLKLRRCGIQDPGAAALGRALGNNSSLQTLELVCNEIGDSGAQALGQALLSKSCALRTLDLSFTQVGDLGAQAFAQALQSKGCPLRALHLHGKHLPCYQIGDLGAQALGEALQSKSCLLQALDLGGNQIGDLGAEAFGQALQSKSCSLKTLTLRETCIGDGGARALGQALQNKNCPLQELKLQGSGIGNEGATAVVEALKQNKLRALTLGVGVDAHTRRVLSEAARAHPNGVELEFSSIF